jgi:hypothetical protein
LGRNPQRRTFASWMLQAGETNFVVAKMIGARPRRIRAEARPTGGAVAEL